MVPLRNFCKQLCLYLLKTPPATARKLNTSSVLCFKSGRGTGDQGQSSLYSNERRWKNDSIFETLGSTDELNSILGICRELTKKGGFFEISEILTTVQCHLQDLCSHVATPPQSSESKLSRTEFDPKWVEEINKLIDYYGDQPPRLKTFILPGGGMTAAHLQYARSICRRAERRTVQLYRFENVNGHALKYLNRLSDLLFVLGRYVAFVEGNQEIAYRKPT